MRYPDRFIELAIRIAMKSPLTHKYGAILISPKGKILNTGYNYYNDNKRHKFTDKPYSWHAEINACKNIPRNKIKGAIMVLVKIRNNKICDCQCCAVCSRMILSLGVSKIYLSSSLCSV